VDGVNAPVSFAGLACGWAVLYQVDATVRSGIHYGTHSLVLTVNNIASNAVTLAVK